MLKLPRYYGTTKMKHNFTPLIFYCFSMLHCLHQANPFKIFPQLLEPIISEIQELFPT